MCCVKFSFSFKLSSLTHSRTPLYNRRSFFLHIISPRKNVITTGAQRGAEVLQMNNRCREKTPLQMAPNLVAEELGLTDEERKRRVCEYDENSFRWKHVHVRGTIGTSNGSYLPPDNLRHQAKKVSRTQKWLRWQRHFFFIKAWRISF